MQYIISKMKSMFEFNVSLKNRQKVGGIIFALPFIVGFILFFLYPFIQVVIFSFNELQLRPDGYELIYQGLSNYSHVFLVDPDFNRLFIDIISRMISNVPLILSFSFFAAVLLNQKFKGRTLARAIFFLPVIMGAGIILQMESMDVLMEMMEGTETEVFRFSSQALKALLLRTKLPIGLMEYIFRAVEGIPSIIRSSGIQILIFLAGLQSIPPSIYEAADVEGATGWESFWLITFPMISPLIITNTVYTVIDMFIKPSNELVFYIKDKAFSGAGYGVSSAMSIIYFLAVFIILGVVYAIVNRHVFYQE